MGDQRSREGEPSPQIDRARTTSAPVVSVLDTPELTLQSTIGNRATERLLSEARYLPVQRSPAGDGDGAPRETPDQVYALSDQGGGVPLDGATRQQFEPALGMRLDDVRIHTGPGADAAARSVRALAYTHGSNIVFRDGQYRPASEQGSQLLAHELTHVVQQRNGTPIPGGVSQPGDAPERQAEEMARSLLSTPRQSASALPIGAAVPRGNSAIQRSPDPYEPIPIKPKAKDAGALRKEAAGLLENLADALVSDPDLQSIALENATYLIVGNRVTWYHSDGKLITYFHIDPSATIWGPGIYLRTPKDDVYRYVTLFGRPEWVPWTWPKQSKAAYLRNWLPAPDVQAFKGAIPDYNDAPILVVIPADPNSAKRDAHSAARIVDQVKGRMQARVPGTGEGDKSEGGDKDAPPKDKHKPQTEKPPPDTRTPQQKIGEPPDKLVVWSNENGVYVNVWVDGAVSSVEVDGSEDPADLEEMLQDAADDLREARDPEQSKGIKGGPTKTGFVPKPDSSVPRPVGGQKIANVPEYPSSIKNYGPDTTVPGSITRFEMVLDYRPAGGTLVDQVTARMQPIQYYWELLDVTGLTPEKVDEAQTRRVGSGEHITDLDVAERKLGQTFEKIGEDTSADLRDVAESRMPLEAKAAWLAVVGISNIVQIVGSPISSFIDAVTKPLDEQQITWSEEGDFLLRCVATPSHEDDAVYIRASSVASTLIRVEEIHHRAASVNDRAESEIARLTKELAEAKTDKDKASLNAQITALQNSLTATTSELGASALELTNQRLAVAEELQADETTHKRRQDRKPEVRLLAVQLELQHRDEPDYNPARVFFEYVEALRRQKAEVEGRVKLTGDVVRKMPGTNYHPRVTLVSEENGQVNELLTVLGEASDSVEGYRHYLLADVTTSNPHDRYIFEGESAQPGVAGHSEAIRKAFVDFRENNGYGRGTIAIRLPSTLEKAVGGALNIEPEMRSAPGSRARVMQRLKDLATAAEVASLFVTGPAGLAIGAIGGVAGAIVAIDSIQRRRAGVGFSWTSFETIMDISSIVGGFVGVAGAGLQPISKLPRWASKVERIQGMIHIFGVAQMGAQVIVIPVQLEIQLSEIDNTPGLSEGERAARKAEAYLQAVRSGLVTVVSASQMSEAHSGKGPKTAGEIAAEGNLPSEHTGGGEHATQGGEGPAATSEREAGAVEKKGDTPDARESAAPPASFTRMEALEPLLGDLQGQVKVVENPNLKPGSARVRYRDGELQIEIGKGSGAKQVRSHVETARMLLKYKGPLGKLRQILSKIVEVFTRIPGYGTQGFESRLEVRKLRQILDTLQQTQMAIEKRFESASAREGAPSAKEQQAIENEIAALEHQLKYHEALVDSLDPGSGHVAAYATTTEALFAAQLPDLRAVEAGLATSTIPNSAKQIDSAAAFHTNGRLQGMETWLAETAKVAGSPEILGRRMKELENALSLINGLPPGSTVQLTFAPGRGLFLVEPSTPGAIRPAPAAGSHVEKVRSRFPDAESQRAFDTYVRETFDEQGKDPEIDLPKIPDKAVDNYVKKVRERLQTAEERATRARGIADPHNATFKNQKARASGVVVEWTLNEPADTIDELTQADHLAANTKEKVRFYGDDFPGIDGTIGDPPRLMQLKGIKGTVDNGIVRARAAQALEKAGHLGLPGVEVHIEAPNLAIADVQAHWNDPDPFDHKAAKPVFSGGLISHVDVWCSDGRLRITQGATGFVFQKI